MAPAPAGVYASPPAATPAAIAALLRARPTADAPEDVKAAWLERKEAIVAAIAAAEPPYDQIVGSKRTAAVTA